MITLAPYCKDSFAYHRRQSRVVHIGDVSLGGDYPIRIQSMTISDTMDTAATVAETIQLVEAGCELRAHHCAVPERGGESAPYQGDTAQTRVCMYR